MRLGAEGRHPTALKPRALVALATAARPRAGGPDLHYRSLGRGRSAQAGPLTLAHFSEVLSAPPSRHDWRGLAWQSALGVAEASAKFADYDFARLCLGKGAA
jgi:hypothetical protein